MIKKSHDEIYMIKNQMMKFIEIILKFKIFQTNEKLNKATD
jgi:hypothetical protein